MTTQQSNNKHKTDAKRKAIKELYLDDQKSRINFAELNNDELISLFNNDAERRNKLLSIISYNQNISCDEWYYAAVIMQHGGTLSDLSIALEFAKNAIKCEPANKEFKWLAAAIQDRILMISNLPQWYGTQYYKDSNLPNSHFTLWPIDPDKISDEERINCGINPASQIPKFK
jgi:hypothetical protein